MPASSSSSAPLIKGYLPVRLRLPRQSQLLRRKDSNDNDETEDTFFFVREHQGKAADSDEKSQTTSKRGATLFVANAPVIPGISTKLLLKSIFGRFADVTRVTAVQNPRAAASAAALTEDEASNSIQHTTTRSLSTASTLLAWTDKQEMFQPTFLPHILSATEGKYAHVVFSSAKEMKKAKKELEDLMSNSASNGSRRRSKGSKTIKKGDGQENEKRVLILDKLELQTLSDESLRQRKKNIRNLMKDDCFDSIEDSDADTDIENSSRNGDMDSNEKPQKYANLLLVAQRYRESCMFLKSRSQLMEECNAVMQSYEDAEEAKRRAQEVAKSQPDDDGFITVSYSNAVGSKVEFEQSETATTPSRRKGNKRSRKKKEAVGSGQLQDFYRFQRADNRKRTMEDLRKKFEEDLRKVKRLKEEKEYRPF